MSKWETFEYLCLSFLVICLFALCACAVILFIVAIPMLGVVVWTEVSPVVGIPLTIVLSLVSLALLVLIVGSLIRRWKERR